MTWFRDARARGGRGSGRLWVATGFASHHPHGTMSYLRVLSEANPHTESLRSEDFETISAALKKEGIRFERWNAAVELPPGAGQDAVLQAYQKDVDRLKAEGGYQSVDVVRLAPKAQPTEEEAAAFATTAAQARQKFLQEHRHSEDEVRVFVEGSGVFYLHLREQVYCLLCERGDLVSVPANTPHWFDMGERPAFAAIRLFTNPDGWVAQFTGSPISAQFPTYEEIVSSRGQS